MLKHAKVNLNADGPDPSLVQPTDWNADHVFTGDVTLPGNLLVNNKLWFTGVTAATPMLKNVGAALYVRKGDDTGYAPFVSGNIGVSRVPDPWAAAYPNLALGGGGSVGGAMANGSVAFYQNLYYDGAAYRAINNENSSIYQLNGGINVWFTAPNVAAGAVATITERMRLDFAGNLGLGRTPDAWGATRSTLQFGGGGAIGGGKSLTADVSLYNNLYDAGANYRYILGGDNGGLLNINSGVVTYYAAPVGAAGAVAALTAMLRMDPSGQLYCPYTFGNAKNWGKANCVNNVQVNAFSWAAPISNLTTGFELVVVITVDDSNSGYCSYSGILQGHASSFGGGVNAQTLQTVNGLATSINSGALAVSVDTACNYTAGNVFIRFTPRITGASSNAGSTARIQAKLRLNGVDELNVISGY